MTATPLWAFGFGTPLLLWGLALGVLPLVIHLLQRRKYRETEWAAMRFLLAAVKKNSRRMRFEQWIVLLVRMLILLLAVLALAQPQFGDLGPLFTQGMPTHRILLLDTSFSLGFKEDTATRFQREKHIIQQMLDQGRQGDAWNLVRIAGSEPRTIIRQPSFQPVEVQAELDPLTLPDEFGEVLPSLQAVAQLTKSLPEMPRKEVYILTDFQRANWAPDAGQNAAEIRSLLQQIGQSARLQLIDVGQPGDTNQAVTSLELMDPFVAVQQPARFKAIATVWGTSPALPVPLEFWVDGKLQEVRQVKLTSNAETIEFFSHVFPQGGEHRVQIKLAPDALPVDNQRQLVVPVRERLRILCVNGKLAGRPRDAATFHLELALQPDPQASESAALIQPQVIKYSELRGFDVTDYDVVCLCNIAAFDDAEARLLESYLRGGGSVIWALGDRVQADNYNRLLYRDGAGILPARLDQRRGNAADPQQGFGFDPLEYAHPVVKVFQGNTDSGLERTQTYEYFQTTLAPGSATHKVLAFTSGDAAILEHRVGTGRAILVTTSLDQSWGSWALWPSYVPLVQELVQWSVRDAAGERSRHVGESLQRLLPTRGAEVTADVVRPDATPEPARTMPQGSLTDFIYDHTDLAGWYELQLGPPLARRETFAVNVDPRESQLQPLTREELDQDILPGVPFEYATEWGGFSGSVTQVATEWAHWSRWLLYLVLYLLLVEQLLAWNFAIGLWGLCPPLALWRWWRGRSRV